MTSELQRLKGKNLRSVSTETKASQYSEDRLITFHCDDGDYVFRCEGDCCSSTYINSIDGPQKGRVLDVLEPEWDDKDGRTWDEENGEKKFYKVTLAIEGAGHLDIEYRNESNGYYGGSLELLASPSEGEAR
jgi:hypothetical protein